MGLASEQEAKQVAEMAARYPEVKAELAAIEASMENFDRKNAVEPPAHLKEKILSQIGSTVHSSPSTVSGPEERGKIRSLNESATVAPKQSNVFKYAAAVLFILLAGAGVFIMILLSEVSHRGNAVASLDVQNDSLMRLVDSNRVRLTQLQSQVALLSAPGMKSIELKGMDVAPDAKAMAYANTSTGEVYLEIMNLPAAPDGMQYQFWGIVDGKPVGAGMIPLDDTTGIHPMTTVPNAVAYAISLEPKGGSAQPTGKIYVMGNS